MPLSRRGFVAGRALRGAPAERGKSGSGVPPPFFQDEEAGRLFHFDAPASPALAISKAERLYFP